MTEPIVPQKAPFAMETPAGSYLWCACGKSATQPFCDGSHAGTGISPKRVEVAEARKIAWCGCKHAGNASPFCDGTHRKV